MMNKTKGNAFKGGSYSIVITCIVLAILIAVNIFVSSLSPVATKYDISAAKLYSITSSTKVVVNDLDKDVTIYWIVQSGKEDEVIDNLLAKYESLSSHISVVKKNPDVFPTFAQNYTDEEVANNSLVVESDDRYRYIAYDDIYVSDGSMYSYSYSTSFDGEGAITSAIKYVVSENLPQIYCLEGHGESELPDSFSDQIEKDNIEVNTISLLNIDEIPEDAECLIIYDPQSDISTEECDMLIEYANDGGKLLVMAGPVEDDSLENLNSVLSYYGVTVNEGIVIEQNRDNFAFQSPFILLPDVNSSDVSDSLIEENYFPIIPIASGLTVDSSADNITEILTTSDESFSKIEGYKLTDYDMGEDDIAGPFAVALSIETDGEGRIIWFSSAAFLDDMYNAYSSGANTDLAMNSLSSMISDHEVVAIRSKSLNYNYLTISDTQGSMIKTLMIGFIPVVYLAIGIYVYVFRRKMQNEAS